MNIRPATPADVPTILALERISYTAAHWGEVEYKNVFAAGSTPRIMLVAEDESLAGFIVVRTLGPEWELENVAVAQAYRRRHVGSDLIASVATQAAHRGAEAVILEVRASNTAARALYERAGFVEVGRRPGYYGNPTEDAALYRLDIRSRLSNAP